LALCLDTSVDVGAQGNLAQRMGNAEARFAPRLSVPVEALQIGETAAPGDPIGSPLTVESAGQTINGRTSEIVEFLISRGADVSPSTVDGTGSFEISASGQLSVAPGATLVPGSYPLFVLPVNDAGQKDADGNILGGIPGFFPVKETRAVTVFVGAVPAEPANDVASTFEGEPVTIAVTGNDGGGAPTSLDVVTAPTNGTVSVNADLTATYTPTPGFVGTDTFSYTASNTAGTSASAATVTVNVLSAGSLLAVDDSFGIAVGRDTVLNVLQNDLNAISGGANPTVVTLTSSLDPTTEGQLTLDGQSIIVTPVEDASGTLSFSYSATNPAVAGDVGSSATVTLRTADLEGTVLSDAIVQPELKAVA